MLSARGEAGWAVKKAGGSWRACPEGQVKLAGKATAANPRQQPCRLWEASMVACCVACGAAWCIGCVSQSPALAACVPWQPAAWLVICGAWWPMDGSVSAALLARGANRTQNASRMEINRWRMSPS